jgi:hypothetical protein
MPSRRWTATKGCIRTHVHGQRMRQIMMALLLTAGRPGALFRRIDCCRRHRSQHHRLPNLMVSSLGLVDSYYIAWQRCIRVPSVGYRSSLRF